ncbi:nicotinate-nucleotide adenylyltransferase [Pantoea sp. Nvir]|uniref:nicotinate-nucleotide adenylyltransferase n=1 Tax=Pantoea sp. Nvir TaxID=2576760 RepID=UPI0013577769|nr:nicotinate-nucleotide adenylyltransferase [Pantoea sp. Nvir]MXP66346.1 nicotinate-nucleotide adenylyltransferase [Pantoea sp. Nvir]CAJ0993027.1 Nicotinate-nucleotide adenylyltransferase [Pantoea sp. Nvir]
MYEMYAVFGGTFDPVHFGHLFPVEALAQQAKLTRVLLLPNNVPPHRPQPEASAVQRMNMLRYAIRNRPLFEIDSRELMCDTPSWTVATLEVLRNERGPQAPLGLIIGQDSLLSLSKWYRWQDLLSLSHLLVCKRSGYSVELGSPEIRRWLDKHITTQIEQLHQHPAGFIWMANTPLVNISATGIRQRRLQGLDCNHLLPADVFDYINRAGLYLK